MPSRPLGRRPASNKPHLALKNYLTGVLPPVPVTVDYLSNFTGWQMLGNNQYGDCVSVACANNRALITTALTGTTQYPSLEDVIAFYKTQNPNFPSDDNGMDVQTALGTLITHGIGGHTALGFAKVDHTNMEEVRAAIAVFGSLILGVVVQQANQDEFDAGIPWDYVPGSPVEGGHAVLAGGYASESASDVRFVTWAKETSFTDQFWAKEVEECWVVIWPEHLGSKQFMSGVDLSMLANDYTALTGRPFPAVVPAPTPAPVPPTPPTPPAPVPPTPAPPVPEVADKALFYTALTWASQVDPSNPENKALLSSIMAWAAKKGLS